MKQKHIFLWFDKNLTARIFFCDFNSSISKRFPQFITTALLYFVEKLRRSAETAPLFSYMKLSQGFNV